MASENKVGALCLIKCGAIEFLSQLKVNFNQSELLKLIEMILRNLLKIKHFNELENDYEEPLYYTAKHDKDLEKVEVNAQSFGYFDEIDSNDDTSHFMKLVDNKSLDCDIENFFNLCIFPTISLTDGDKNVLSGCLGTLKNDDFRVVLSGIQFFIDVILEDFPAPVFLQRQGALKILLHYLSENRFASLSIRALKKYCDKLRKYMQISLNPNYYSTKNAFSIIKQSNEEEKLFGTSFRPNEMLDLMYEPQLNAPIHMPVPVFALQTVSKSLLQFLEPDNQTVTHFPDLLNLICMNYQLLYESTSVGSSIEDSHNLTSLLLNGGDWWNIKDLLMEQLALWGRLLGKYSAIDNMEDNHHVVSINHRQVYVSLFTIFWQMFSTIINPQLALKLVPDECRTEICRALFDRCLATILQDKFDLLLDYVKYFNQPLAKLYVELTQVLDSSNYLLEFFLHYNEPIKYAEVCIESATKSLNCIDFIQSNKFTKDFINFFSVICSTEMFADSENMLDKCDNIFEKLASSTNIIVTKAVFIELFDLIKTNVCIEELSKPRATCERRILFILRSRIFYYIIEYGLFNIVSEIRETCNVIFCKLWDSQGLLSVNTWLRVSELTNHNLLLLQPMADTTTRLGRHILQWSFSGITKTKLALQRDKPLISLLPLFYHSNSLVRNEASGKLEEYLRLTNETRSKPGVWSCSLANIRSMCDFLVTVAKEQVDNNGCGDCNVFIKQRWLLGNMLGDTNNKSPIKRQSANGAYGVENENFMKILNIYMSDNVDISVRKSAAEQLAIFLQAPRLHCQFINNGGLHYLLRLIKSEIFDKSHTSLLLSSSLLILLRLLQYSIISQGSGGGNSGIISELVLDSSTDSSPTSNESDSASLIQNLVQMALYFCYDKQSVADLSGIIGLLIFHSVIKLSNSNSSLSPISMPEYIVNKMILPFPVDSYPSIIPRSINQSPLISSYEQINKLIDQLNGLVKLSTNQKWDYHELIRENIRIHWCLMKHGGLINYINFRYCIFGKQLTNETVDSDYCSLIDEILIDGNKLKLTQSDEYKLYNTVSHMILCDNLHKMDNATSHCQVQCSLASIQSILVLIKFGTVSTDNLIVSVFNNPSIWLTSFKRFLINIPSCSADYLLLELIMDLLQLVFKLSNCHQLPELADWLTELLIKPNNPLIYCLSKTNQIVGKTDSRRLTLAKHSIEVHLPLFFIDTIRFLSLVHKKNAKSRLVDEKANWKCLLKTLFSLGKTNLTIGYNNNPFDNLGMLLSWLKLFTVILAYPTGNCVELFLMTTNSDIIDTESLLAILSTCSRLIDQLQDSQEESFISFMGTGTIKQLLMLIINLLDNNTDQSNDCKKKSKSHNLINKVINKYQRNSFDWLVRSPWLLQLLGYRDCEIRALSIGLVNLLIGANDEKLLEIIFDQCDQLLPESLWLVMLTLFTDASEAGIVRAEAVGVLQTLCTVLPIHNSIELNSATCAGRMTKELKLLPNFIDPNTGIQYIGINGLFRVLKSQDLLRKIGMMLTNFVASPNMTSLLDPSATNSGTDKHLDQLLKSQATSLNFTTPILLAPVLGFLSNLFYYLPNEMILEFNELRINTIIMNLLDSNLLVSYYKLLQHQIGASNLHQPNRFLTTCFINFIGLINGFCGCVGFMRFQMNQNSHYRDSFLTDDRFVGSIIELLISIGDWKEICLVNQFSLFSVALNFDEDLLKLKMEIIQLLMSLVIPCPIKSHLQLLLTHLSSNCLGLVQCLMEMLDNSQSKAVNCALQFLIIFSSLDYSNNRPNQFIMSLEEASQSIIERVEVEADGGNGTTSRSTCTCLMEDMVRKLLNKRDQVSTVIGSRKQQQKSISNNTSQRLQIHCALKIIIGVSVVAKSYLLQAGFIESLNEEVKYLHTKLDQTVPLDHVCSTTKSNGTQLPWKCIIRELIGVLELLQNMIYDYSEAQMAAVSSNVHKTIYRLWTLALLDQELMHSILRCYINISSMIITSRQESETPSLSVVTKRLVRGLIVSISDNGGHSNCSNIPILDNLVRLLVSIIGTDDDNVVVTYQIRRTTARLIFRLLSNLAWSPDIVVALTRLKLIDRYQSLNPNQLQKVSAGLSLQMDWLKLLTGLSFSHEGLVAIGKSAGSQAKFRSTNEAGGIFKVFNCQLNIDKLRPTALLIIRNICTHPTVKLKVVVDGSGLLDSLIKYLNVDSNVYVRQLILSSIKALIYSNNKIRGYLKSTNLLDQLSDLREQCEEEMEIRSNERNKENSHVLLSVLSDVVLLTNVLKQHSELV